MSDYKQAGGKRRRSITDGFKYAVMVDGKPWCYSTRADLAESAAEAARRGWAKGRAVKIEELK